METGTCVRHAIAKALAVELRGKFFADKKPKDLLELLIMARRDLGAGGAHPEDWDDQVLTLVGKDGHVYDCTISVIQSSFDRFVAGVLCVDMRKVLPRMASMQNF